MSSTYRFAAFCRSARTMIGLGLLLLGLTGPAVRGQSLTWQAVVAAGQTSSSNSAVGAMATDASGNVYVAGYFFGNLSLGATTLVNVSQITSDVFVAKWSPATSSFVWALRAGGQGNDYGNGLAVNGSSVYLSGSFDSPTMSFGSVVLTNTGAYDAYVVKLTDAGPTASFVWAQRADAERADALAVSGANVYVAGGFLGATAQFGPLTLANADPSGSTADLYIAKLTDAGPTGSFVWAQRAGGLDYESASALAVNGANVYLAGFFASSTMALGAITLTNASQPAGGFNSDAFVAKFVDAGASASVAWAQRAGGLGSEGASALAVNGSNVYVAGSFSSPTLVLGSATLTNANPGPGTGPALTDAFVAKLTDAGTSSSFIWAQRAGGTDSDEISALAVRGTSVYAAGTFRSTAAAFGTTTLVGSSSGEVFVAELADAGSTGQFMGAQQGGGPGTDQANVLALSATAVYVGGTVSPPATFGNVRLTSPVGSGVAFLASLTGPALASQSAIQLAGVRVVPNPAHGLATVQLPGTPSATRATLTLSDVVGRVVYTQVCALPAGGLVQELNLALLAPGLYYLRVQAGAASAGSRLLVE
ncbi:hypothetical protein [Hymenobacter sp. UYCo722]|uniref:hypothetical protein n=1 Tax=Hymenobacter sp. UYCo722 TaxID=3156335 RepID=UPI0033989EC3